jgi:hypothetical protein
VVSYSVTKTVSIDAPVSKVFAFMTNLGNWPKWASSSVVTVKPGSADWWALETRTGLGRLRMRSNEALGILDYDLVALGAQWVIPSRVVVNGEGSEFTMTFIQPPTVSKEVFEKQVGLFENDLVKLKTLMES